MTRKRSNLSAPSKGHRREIADCRLVIADWSLAKVPGLRLAATLAESLRLSVSTLLSFEAVPRTCLRQSLNFY